MIIKGGYVIDPKSGYAGLADIAVWDGRILQVKKPGEAWTDAAAVFGVDGLDEGTETVQVIDAKGLTVAPGLVDVHVHFRDPGFTYKEDISTGAKAAAKASQLSLLRDSVR